MKQTLKLIALSAALGFPAFAEDPKPEKPAENKAPAPESQKQEKPAETQKAPEPKPAEAGKSDGSSAEEVLKELLRRRAESPLNEPKREPAPAKEETTKAVESAKPIGTSPVAIRTPAGGRSEGTFILNRRGRLMRGPDAAAPWLFTFDSDTQGLKDAPLHVMPCQELENAERLLEEHGESLPLTITGRVFTYRGKTFLLPSQLAVSPNRGNLQR